MTSQSTIIQPSMKGARALVGAAAATLALVGGALLWQGRPASETAAPAATTMVSTVADLAGAQAGTMGPLAEGTYDTP